MTELTLLACFITGLVSTLHCWGMCGGISTMLFSTARPTTSRQSLVAASLAYNVGRVFSYSLIGLITGTFSAFGAKVFFLGYSHFILQLLSSVILIIIALKILGRFAILDLFEKQMRTLWSPMQRVLGFLLPAQSLLQQFCVGMIWGWIPCGMVYSVLLLTLTSGNAIDSMLYMLAFGIGTLPGMVTLNTGTGTFLTFLKGQGFRYLSATLIILIALWQPVNWLFLPKNHHHHEHHHHHSKSQNPGNPDHHIDQNVPST